MAPKVPKFPTRTDAYVQCGCGGTAKIATVTPIPDDPDHMRHLYACPGCGQEMTFDVAKKPKAQATEGGGASHG